MAKTFQLTAQLNLAAPNNLRSVVSNIRSQLGDVDVRVNVNMGNAIKNIKEARTEMEAFGFQSGLAIKRFAAFSVATAGIIGFVSAIKNGFTEAIKFDREMVRLAQVLNTSVKGVREISTAVDELSRKFGVSSTELLDVSTTLAQAGLTAKETKVALEALAKSSLAPSFDNLKDTTEGVIAAMRQFNLGAHQVEAALGSINSVAAAFAVESGDIITAIRTTGGVFASASKGVAEGTDALNQFISVFTSVRQTTRESAESIATGLRTIFTRIQRPRTIAYLQEFGIELKDLEGKFVGPYEAIKRLSNGLRELDNRDPRFAAITEELGGYRQLSKIIPAIQQFAVSQKALGIAEAGTTSLTRDSATAQQALAVQIAKVREEFLSLIRSLASSTLFTTLAKQTLSIASGFISIAKAIEPILPLLTVLAGIKLASGLTQFSGGFLGAIKRGGGAGGVGAGLGGLLTGQQARPYATGGIVPGVGNTDSVLTRLMPGEFVVQKSAVAALGEKTLHSINKYAGGYGPSYKQLSRRNKGLEDPQYIASLRAMKNSDPAAYQAIVDAYEAGAPNVPAKAKSNFKYGSKPGSNDLIVDGSYGGLFFQLGTNKVVNSLVGTTPGNLSKESQAAIASKFGKVGKILGQPYQFFINKNKKQEFGGIASKSFDQSLKNVLDSQGGAASVSASLGISEDELLKRLKKQTGYEQLAGSLFESYVGVLAGQVKDTSRGRSFDFNPVGAGFEKLFGPGVNSIRHADAKYTSNAKSRSSIVEKAINTYLSGEGAGINVSQFGAQSAKDRFAGFKAKDLDIFTKGGIPHKAGGGSGDGLSMVMPGEFILNANSAARLGPEALHTINNAHKYAFGGIFGKIGRGLKRLSPFGLEDDTPSNRQGIADLTGSATGVRGYSPGDLKQKFDTVYQETRAGGQGQYAGFDQKQENDRIREEATLIARTRGIHIRDATKLAQQQSRLNGFRPAQQQDPLSVGATVSLNAAKDQLGVNYDRGSVIPTSGPKTVVGPDAGPGRLARFGAALDSGSQKVGGRLIAGAAGVAFAGPALKGLAGNNAAANGAIGALEAGAGGAAAGGAIAGPVGAIIGGITGAVGGFISAFKEAGIKAAVEKLTKSTDKLEKGFLQYAKGEGSQRGLAQDTESALSAASLLDKGAVGSSYTDAADLYGGGIGGHLQSGFTALASYLPSGFGGDTARASIQSRVDLQQKQEAQDRLQNRQGIGAVNEKYFARLAEQGGIKEVGGRIDRNDEFANVSAVTAFGEEHRSQIRSLAYTGARAQSNTETIEVAKKAAENGGRKSNETDAAYRARVAKAVSDAEFNLGKTRLDEIQILGTLTTANKKAATELAIFSDELEKIGARVGRVSAESDNRGIGVENAFATANNQFGIGRQASNLDVFTNNRAYSQDETRSAFAGLGLGADATNRLSGAALSTKALQENLPTELLKLYSGGNSQADVSTAAGANDSINKILKAQGLSQDSLPRELRDEITSAIAQQTEENKQSGSQNSRTYFEKELPRKLASINEAVFKAGAELQKGLEAANNTYLAGINQYINQSLKATSSLAAADKSRANNENSLIRLTGRSLTEAQFGAPDSAEIDRLTGVKGSGAGSIIQTIGGLDKKKADLNSQLSGLDKGSSDYTNKSQALLDALAGVEEGLGNNIRALELSTEASGKLAGIQQTLAKEQEGRDKGRGLASQAVGRSRVEVARGRRDARLADDVLSGRRNVNSLSQRNAEGVFSAMGAKIDTITDDDEKEKALAQKARYEHSYNLSHDKYKSRSEAEAAEKGINEKLKITEGKFGQRIYNNGTAAERKAAAEAGSIYDGQNAGKDFLGNRQKPRGVDSSLATNRAKAIKDVQAAGNKIGEFSNEAFAANVNNLNAAADKLAALSNTKISLEGTHTVNVNITGGDSLKDGIGLLVQAEVGKAIKALNMPKDQQIENKQGMA